MTKIRVVLTAASSLGALLITATAHADEPGANSETQHVAPRRGAPAPATGWTNEPRVGPPPAAAPAAAPAPAPATKSSSVTLKVSTESSREAPRDDGGAAAPQEGAPAPAPESAPRGRLLPTASSLRMGPNAEADRPTDPLAKTDALSDARFLHGFRIGYSYVANHDKPLESLDGKSFKDKTGTKSPNSFLLGYEVVVRMVGHSWLNVILVGNGLLAGLEQSKFLPSGNALIGFEFNNSFQVGVGAHLTPLKGQEAHTAFAAGWTPRVGTFYVPLHAFFVPDVDGNHRMGMLTGVTF